MAGTAKAADTLEKVSKKVYKLRSTNKFLTVSALGVQFMNGKFQTTDPDVAKALMDFAGVELEEE